MNDRELVELAAKAAGIVGAWHRKGFVAYSGWSKGIFDPMNDDGDALRLAVKLGLCVLCHATQVEYSMGGGRVGIVVEQKFRDQTATRRAITRAAAEIGKGM